MVFDMADMVDGVEIYMYMPQFSTSKSDFNYFLNVELRTKLLVINAVIISEWFEWWISLTFNSDTDESNPAPNALSCPSCLQIPNSAEKK